MLAPVLTNHTKTLLNLRKFDVNFYGAKIACKAGISSKKRYKADSVQ